MTCSHAADGVYIQLDGQSLEVHGLALGAKGHAALLWRRRCRRCPLTEHGGAPQLLEEMSLRSMAYVTAHKLRS